MQLKPTGPVERWEVYMMWGISLAIEIFNMTANYVSARRTKKTIAKTKSARSRSRRR